MSCRKLQTALKNAHNVHAKRVKPMMPPKELIILSANSVTGEIYHDSSIARFVERKRHETRFIKTWGIKLKAGRRRRKEGNMVN